MDLKYYLHIFTHYSLAVLENFNLNYSFNSSTKSCVNDKCTWVRAIASKGTGWAEKCALRAALQRRTWSCWWMRSSR